MRIKPWRSPGRQNSIEGEVAGTQSKTGQSAEIQAGTVLNWSKNRMESIAVLLPLQPGGLQVQLSLTNADAQQQQRHHLAIHLGIIFSSLFWSNSMAPTRGSLFHHLSCSLCCYTALRDTYTYNYHLSYGRWVSLKMLLHSVKARPACLLLHCPFNSLCCTMHDAWDIIARRTFDSSTFSLQSHSCLQKLGIHQWHKTSENQEMVHVKCRDCACTHLDQSWIFQMRWSERVSCYIALDSEIL